MDEQFESDVQCASPSTSSALADIRTSTFIFTRVTGCDVDGDADIERIRVVISEAFRQTFTTLMQVTDAPRRSRASANKCGPPRCSSAIGC